MPCYSQLDNEVDLFALVNEISLKVSNKNVRSRSVKDETSQQAALENFTLFVFV